MRSTNCEPAPDGAANRSSISVRDVLHAFPNPCAANSEQMRKFFGVTWNAADRLRRMAIEQIVNGALSNPPEPVQYRVRQVMDECGVCAEEARTWLRMQGRGYEA